MYILFTRVKRRVIIVITYCSLLILIFCIRCIVTRHIVYRVDEYVSPIIELNLNGVLTTAEI